jgi:transposase InsO family protein
LDLIVNLPWSGEYNAILVVVDRLSKHASFIPTTSGLTAEGFADLFVQHVVSRFGLPDNIVADWDPQWASDFWSAVVKALKTKMSLSSAHHPQHDGQTENVNRQLETLLRAYIARDRSDWSEWLKILEFAYNNNVHASTGAIPFQLLYGFLPKSPGLPDDGDFPRCRAIRNEQAVKQLPGEVMNPSRKCPS